MKTENITRDRVKRGIHGQKLKTEWKVENIFSKKNPSNSLVYNIHTIFMYVPEMKITTSRNNKKMNNNGEKSWENEENYLTLNLFFCFSSSL